MSEAITFIIGLLVGFLARSVWLQWGMRAWSREAKEADRRFQQHTAIFEESCAVYEACIAADKRGDRGEFERLREKHRELKKELDRL